MEQRGVLGHHGDGPPQRALIDAADVLPVDADHARTDVIEPLHQLDEGRLARARRPDQRHPLARRDGQVEVLVERLRLVLVGEGHGVEDDLAQVRAERRRVRPVHHLGRLAVVGGHVLGVVQALLQHPHVVADVAQVAAHQHEGGDSEGHIARRGLALGPQVDQQAGQSRLEDDEQARQQGPGVLAPAPGDLHRPPPLVHHPGEALLLAALGAEALDGGVGGDRVGQRAADARVQRVGAQVRRPHVAAHHQHVGGDVEDHHHAGEQADHRPADQHHHRQAGQHQQSRAQHHDHDVRHRVIAPHGAGDLAHGRAGEVVGVPVGGELLHPRHVGL